MQVNEIERSKDGNVSYKVSLPGEKVDEALERVYKDLVKRINIPGFRKGKIPKKVLEVRVGKEYFEEEAKKILVEESYYDAFRQINDKVLNQNLDNVELEVGKGFSYVIKLETVPEIEVSSEHYKNIEVKFTPEEYTEEKYQKALEGFLSGHGKTEDVTEDRALEDGDIAVINFVGKIDDKPFENGSAENYSLKLGSKSFIDNFEEQLVGMKPGDKKEISVKFPENYQEEKLAGKPAKFDVEVIKIQQNKLPEINEEFLKKIKYDSKQALEDDYRKKTKETVERNNKIGIENKILEKILEKVEVDVPKSMVEFLVDRKISEFEHNIKSYFPNLTLSDYLKATNVSEDDLREKHREQAKDQAKIELLLKNIARVEKIAVKDEDINSKIEEMASKMNQDSAKIRKSLELSDNIKLLEEEILLEKTVEFLKENADIKPE